MIEQKVIKRQESDGVIEPMIAFVNRVSDSVNNFECNGYDIRDIRYLSEDTAVIILRKG